MRPFRSPILCNLSVENACYKDHSQLTLEERQKINYNHPFAFDNNILVEHVAALRDGKSIQQPVYSFVNHTRLSETIRLNSAKIVVLEGILVLEDPRLRDLCDIKVYVDTDADERFIRRLKRDIIERGRSVDSVIDQYLSSVRPMQLQFVEPTKRYADIILPGGGSNTVAIGLLVARIRARLSEMAALS